MGMFDFVGDTINTVTGGIFGGTMPEAPKKPKFKPDPFISSPGYGRRLRQGEEKYFGALMDYADRDPGFTEEEKQEMYAGPAEQSKFSEAQALRRLNQGASFGGAYEGGARQAGRGQILTGFGASRADLRRKVLTDAAKAALQDRMNQIAALQNYASTRMGTQLQHTALRNQQELGIYQAALQQYGMDLGQYNKQMDRNMNMAGAILGM
jgi:hypothetical protein